MQLCVVLWPFSGKKKLAEQYFIKNFSRMLGNMSNKDRLFPSLCCLSLQKVTFKFQCPVTRCVFVASSASSHHKLLMEVLWDRLVTSEKLCFPFISVCLFSPRFLSLVQKRSYIIDTAVSPSLQYLCIMNLKCQSVAAGMNGKALSWYSCWHSH